jgi:alkanesulfonate monooxygenase SsuD/methylene tetrahydromethanopterin reductase-like flavin-dependent oxidoreductase (luciferase family)
VIATARPGADRAEPASDQVRFGVYLPQVGVTYPQLLERARGVEDAGLDSVWLFDHLFFDGPPAPVLEAWTTATALLGATSALQVGHLVLCANFRHPVVLGKMVNTLAAIAPGRFVLGLGSGSTEFEHRLAGLPWGTFAERTDRLEDVLAVVTAMVRGAPTEFPNAPVAAVPPPVLIGGRSRRTLDLVARYADWWNCPTYALAELPQLIGQLGEACRAVGRDPASVRISTEAVLALVPRAGDVAEARTQAHRRFGGSMWGLQDELIGTPDDVLPHLHDALALGVRHFVFFLHDRATRATLDLLADEVVAPLRATVSAWSPS